MEAADVHPGNRNPGESGDVYCRPATGLNGSEPGLRRAEPGDLFAINLLIERAIATWRIPERVKRLSMPLYHYQPHDLQAMEIVVAELDSIVCGVVAWEQADPVAAPEAAKMLLLHGLYVDPDKHRSGLGSRLLALVERAASARGTDGVLVRAQPDAISFFRARGWQPLPVEDPRRDYPYRYWKSVQQHRKAQEPEC